MTTTKPLTAIAFVLLAIPLGLLFCFGILFKAFKILFLKSLKKAVTNKEKVSTTVRLLESADSKHPL